MPIFRAMLYKHVGTSELIIKALDRRTTVLYVFLGAASIQGWLLLRDMHLAAASIQGRPLFKGAFYSRLYGIFFNFDLI